MTLGQSHFMTIQAPLIHQAPDLLRRPRDKVALTRDGGHLVRGRMVIGKTRREYTPEYKDGAVKLVINTGKAVSTVARELGISEAALGRGVNSFKARNDTAGSRAV